MTEALYYYTPLSQRISEIRLLTLLPGLDQDRIECQLSSTPLATANDFEALSYHWHVYRGDQIFVNNYKIPVTGNLHDALRHLRYKDNPRKLWIDAICIDQISHSEKSEQIGLMRQIYDQSQQVVAWFGTAEVGSAGTHLLEPFIRRLLRAKDTIESLGDIALKDDDRYYNISIDAFARYGIPGMVEMGYESLNLLISRSWTKRVWIIQEAAVARNVTIQCGEYKFDMKDVALASLFVDRLGLEEHYPSWFASPWAERSSQKQSFFASVWAERTNQMQGNQRHLLSLVQQHRHAEASMPHDKIYALCGLASDAGPNMLNIGFDYYHQVHKVYTEFARKVLCKYRNLDIFSSLASFDERETQTLPSWVPDWRINRPKTFTYERPDPTRQGPSSILFTATKNSLADPRFDDETRRKLLLSGMIIDVVEEISELQLEKYTTFQELSHMFLGRYTVAQYAEENLYPPTKEPMLDALYHTMTMGNLNNQLSDPVKQYTKFDQDLNDLSVVSNSHCNVNQIDSAVKKASKSEVWRSRVFRACQVGIHRRLIRTRNGYLGLVHGQVQVGDKIALCKGGALPLVIRQTGWRKGWRIRKEWKIIGDGYIHGAMHGELFNRIRCKPMWFE